MKKKLMENPYSRKLIICYVRYLCTTIEFAKKAVEGFAEGMLTVEETEYILNHLPQIKKWRLN